MRGLNWAGKNVESLTHVWGKFPSALYWKYKSNTSPHISLLNVLCCLDSGKCFLVAEQFGWLHMCSVLGCCPGGRGCEGGNPEVQLHWWWKSVFVGSAPKGALRLNLSWLTQGHRRFLVKKECEHKFPKYNTSTFPTGL